MGGTEKSAWIKGEDMVRRGKTRGKKPGAQIRGDMMLTCYNKVMAKVLKLQFQSKWGIYDLMIDRG